MLFIHQYPDWTNFRYSRKAIIESLCRIRFLQGNLQGKISFARDPAFLESIRERDLKALFKISHREEVPAIAYAALRNFSLPMNEKRLLSLHAAIVENGGHYRETTDFPKSEAAKDFRGVPWERISQEMTRFFDFFNKYQTDGILKACIAHFWFLSIGPFPTGNGILSRLLCDMLISQSENSSQRFFSINEEISEKRSDYLDTLYSVAHSSGDITEWILWFLSRMETSLENAKREWADRFEMTRRQLLLGKIPLTEREQRLAEYFREHPQEKISSTRWAIVSGISHDSALRDLNRLVEKGIVKKTNEKGRSTKYELV